LANAWAWPPCTCHERSRPIIELKTPLALGRASSSPIAGDKLRAFKRYFTTRTDNLPWLFISKRQAQATRQAVNYIVRLAGEKAKLRCGWGNL
jgi:hypothetical protein